MEALKTILDFMIKNELGKNQEYVISHNQVKNPKRIDVKCDETVFIIETKIDSKIAFWLEYHSAIESRMIVEKKKPTDIITNEIITKHKGNIYFSQSSPFEYTVTYVKLKIIK